MQDALKRKDKVVGFKQTWKAAQESRLECLYIAADADTRMTGQIRQFCQERGVAVEMIETMKQLGKAAGIDVGASVVGILTDNG